MESRIREIDKEISALKSQLNQVEGSTTEVYSRIVGYYRSVKNWNLGKKEEYKKRKTFTTITRTKSDEAACDSPLTLETSSSADKTADAGSITGYDFFYRSSCPNCPAMKDALALIETEGRAINVDSESGLSAAQENLVFSAPTVIFRDKEGREVFRTGHAAEVSALFSMETASA